MRRWWTLTIGAMLALTIAVPAVSARTASPAIPFRADMTGEMHWEFPAPGSECSLVTTVTESSGIGTSIGRVDAVWTHCPIEPIDQDGRVVFVAGGGQELRGEYEYDDVDDGVVTITVVGGTGRFAEASGHLTAVVDYEAQYIPGCDDRESMDCLDFDTPWPWWGSMTGAVSR